MHCVESMSSLKHWRKALQTVLLQTVVVVARKRWQKDLGHVVMFATSGNFLMTTVPPFHHSMAQLLLLTSMCGCLPGCLIEPVS